MTDRLQIFVLIDALGWRFLEGREFLNDLLPHRQPLRTVLGYSSGAIPTILTGVPPARSGHWNLFYYDPNGSPFRWLRHFGFLPKPLLNHWVTRTLLKEMGRRFLGLGPLFECCVSPQLLPWFNWVEKKNIYGRGGIQGAPSIFDELASKGVPCRVYSYHGGDDQEIMRRARTDLAAGQAKFYFVYLSQMDQFLHSHCESNSLFEQKLAVYAVGLRGLFHSAVKLDPGTCFTVLSDHGMTPIRRKHDLVREVEALGFSMPRDYLAVYDSTMARFWFFKEKARDAILEHLKSSVCGRILLDDELQQLGVFFPDGRYGEIIFLLHPGWLLSESDFNGSRWQPVGMHGYHPDDPYSDGIFLSNRQPPVVVQTIADVFKCMQAAAA